MIKNCIKKCSKTVQKLFKNCSKKKTVITKSQFLFHIYFILCHFFIYMNLFFWSGMTENYHHDRNVENYHRTEKSMLKKN